MIGKQVGLGGDSDFNKVSKRVSGQIRGAHDFCK